MATSHPWVSLGGLIGVVIGGIIWSRGRIRKGKGSAAGFFNLDEKGGLLNGGGIEKGD